MSQAKVRI